MPLINGIVDLADTSGIAPPPTMPTPLLSRPLAHPPALGLSRSQPGPRANHMVEADAAIKMTPEEKFLYTKHLENLNGPGKVVHPDGAISTLFQMSFEQDGKTYNIPTIWGGRVLEPREAIREAEKVGLNKFPSYDDADVAASRYEAMHEYLERDTADFIAGPKK